MKQNLKLQFKYGAPGVQLLAVGMLLLALPSRAQQPTPQQRVEALKVTLATSQAMLKPYEWVETTVVTSKGKEKSRQMNQCYNGADGKVQKVPLTTPPPEKKKPGLRGKIAENKSEELADYMKEAIGLVKVYMPPTPVLIQSAKDAGRVAAQPLSAQLVRLTFTGYLKPGDSLALDVDLANNRPVNAKVSTYLDSPKEPVTLDVRFSTLENNAVYPASIVLNAKGKDLKVDVTNSGYRPAGR